MESGAKHQLNTNLSISFGLSASVVVYYGFPLESVLRAPSLWSIFEFSRLVIFLVSQNAQSMYSSRLVSSTCPPREVTKAAGHTCTVTLYCTTALLKFDSRRNLRLFCHMHVSDKAPRPPPIYNAPLYSHVLFFPGKLSTPKFHFHRTQLHEGQSRSSPSCICRVLNTCNGIVVLLRTAPHVMSEIRRHTSHLKSSSHFLSCKFVLDLITS